LSGFHQLPGTLGSNPNDPVRKLADVGDDLTTVLTLDQLEQLAYVLIANLNGETQSGLGGRTALEAMQYFTSKDRFLPQFLPANRRHQLFLLKEAVTCRVSRGKAQDHINFEGVRYTSDVLRRRPELKGIQLRVYYIARDIRHVHAYFEDGRELGVLTASRQWRTVAHSIRTRQEILKLVRLKKLRLHPEDDAVEAYMRYMRDQAKESKKAANAMAKVRAGVKAAEADVQHGDIAFASAPKPAVTREPAPAAEGTSQDAEGLPVPPTLVKTLYF
jgi:putative transposase